MAHRNKSAHENAPEHSLDPNKLNWRKIAFTLIYVASLAYSLFCAAIGVSNASTQAASATAGVLGAVLKLGHYAQIAALFFLIAEVGSKTCRERLEKLARWIHKKIKDWLGF